MRPAVYEKIFNSLVPALTIDDKHDIQNRFRSRNGIEAEQFRLLTQLAKKGDPDAIEFLLNISAMDKDLPFRKLAREVLRDILGTQGPMSRSVREVVANQATELIRLKSLGDRGRAAELNVNVLSLDLMPEIGRIALKNEPEASPRSAAIREEDFRNSPLVAGTSRRQAQIHQPKRPSSASPQELRSKPVASGAAMRKTPELTDEALSEKLVRETSGEISAARKNPWFKNLFESGS